MPYFYKNPSGTSSGALGRRDFVRPEFIAMLNDAGGPRWSYESRAGLLTFVWGGEKTMPSVPRLTRQAAFGGEPPDLIRCVRVHPAPI